MGIGGQGGNAGPYSRRKAQHMFLLDIVRLRRLIQNLGCNLLFTDVNQSFACPFFLIMSSQHNNHDCRVNKL
jgi:hypothetical protein